MVWLLYWLFCYGFDFNILLALSCSKLQKRATEAHAFPHFPMHWGKATACSCWCCISALFCTTSLGAYKKNFTRYELNLNEAGTLVVSLSPSSSQRRHDCLCRQTAPWEPSSFENAAWRAGQQSPAHPPSNRAHQQSVPTLPRGHLQTKQWLLPVTHGLAHRV